MLLLHYTTVYASMVYNKRYVVCMHKERSFDVGDTQQFSRPKIESMLV